MTFDCIVFDWDGTLIDSTATIAEAIRRAAADLDLPVPSVERARHVIGLGLRDALALAVPSLDAERAPQFAERYRAHYLAEESTLQLYDGARALLESIAAARVPLAIATGKTHVGLTRALAATGLAPLFRATRCADQTQPKPHPAMLLELMTEIGVKPDRMLMVGDTTHDLAMAAAAGVPAVAISHGAHAETVLREFAPLTLVHSLPELQAWLHR